MLADKLREAIGGRDTTALALELVATEGLEKARAIIALALSARRKTLQRRAGWFARKGANTLVGAVFRDADDPPLRRRWEAALHVLQDVRDYSRLVAAGEAIREHLAVADEMAHRGCGELAGKVRDHARRLAARFAQEVEITRQ